MSVSGKEHTEELTDDPQVSSSDQKLDGGVARSDEADVDVIETETAASDCNLQQLPQNTSDETADLETVSEPDSVKSEESDALDQVDQLVTDENEKIRIPVKARINEAEELIEILRSHSGDKPLVFDASEVEDITTPYVMAIISGINSRAKETPPAAVISPTGAFVDAFSDLGLFQDLMKMEFHT